MLNGHDTWVDAAEFASITFPAAFAWWAFCKYLLGWVEREPERETKRKS